MTKSLFVLLLGLCLWAPAPARGATLYTGPIPGPVGYQVGCEAVNVSGTNLTITSAILDCDDGTTEFSYTCNSTPSLPGSSATFIVPSTSSGCHYCKFTTSTSSKTTIRANGKSYNPSNGAFSGIANAD
jgi:hypothetical protein